MTSLAIADGGTGATTPQGALTNFATPSGSSVANFPFGGGFKGVYNFTDVADTSHDGSAIAEQITFRYATGTTDNPPGPPYADYAAMFAAKKIDYLSSTVRGEFDGLYCITYQGRYGDSAGVLSDVTKVKGPSPINSGLAMEWASKLVDTDGDQVRNVHGHVGWLLADESESYGYVVESWDKTSKFAYLVDTVTAFGGSSQGWDYILAARQTRSDGNLYFDIDGTGRVHATAGSFGAPSYSFKGDEDTGLYHINTNAIAIITGASNGVIFDATGQFYPMSDNTQRNGVASLRWSVVYAGTGTINTSDADTKQQIGDIDPAVLRAWGKVKYSQYKFNDAVAKKADGARWHIGLIAQQVKDAFESEGLGFSQDCAWEKRFSFGEQPKTAWSC